MANESTSITLTGRDQQLLSLLDWTPATVDLIVKDSLGYRLLDDYPATFPDPRAARERLRKLEGAGLISSSPLPLATGGRQLNYYQLTREGHARLHGCQTELPHRSFFEPIKPSRVQHTLDLARVIVHLRTAATAHQIAVTKHRRENAVTVGTNKPDGIVQLLVSGLHFTNLLEIDEHTEPLVSQSESAIDRKIDGYEAYQDTLLAGRRRNGPRFRVLFFTDTMEHAQHIALRAQARSRNPRRSLVYATTFDWFLGEPDALRRGVFIDHRLRRRSIVDHAFGSYRIPHAYDLLQPLELPL